MDALQRRQHHLFDGALQRTQRERALDDGCRALGLDHAHTIDTILGVLACAALGLTAVERAVAP